MSRDTLSEVLRAVRLKGAVFFSVRAADPWVAETPPACELAPHVMPGAEHVIEYHLVTRGTCYGGLVDGEQVAMKEGDIIVFPQGDAHVMASAPNMRGDPTWGFDPVDTLELPVQVRIGSERDPEVHVICGFLGCDNGPFNPLLASLPRVIHLSRSERSRGLEQLAELALAESSTPLSGSDCVLARLSELLFIEVVRRYIAELGEGETGWLAGLRDPIVGRALACLHHRPAHDWTLEELARESGTSRSVLAERFAHLVGLPPMQYLARWRMQLACGLLSAGGQSLAEVAEAIGYSSEAAFSRAFKREVGVPPASFRERARV